ncbi:hypothetical protein GMSM_12230 [Geomonas sp. Red276]
MDTFVLYCKSYRNDVLRARVLAESVARFNREGLTFYISAPEADLPLFREKLEGLSVTLIADEEILSANPRHSVKLMEELSGGLMQQIVKSEFWRLKLCKNYLMLDSDCYFIRDFGIADFMLDPDTPYTVMHEGKDLLEFAARKGMKKIREHYVKDRVKAQSFFNRPGRHYNYGPIPTICSAAVWESLANNYAEPRNLSFADLIGLSPGEMLWYGEAILAYAPIRLVPIEPLFKVFHYKEQYEESVALGVTEAVLAEDYLGVIRQSNWDRELDLVPKKRRTWRTLWLKRR